MASYKCEIDGKISYVRATEENGQARRERIEMGPAFMLPGDDEGER